MHRKDTSTIIRPFLQMKRLPENCGTWIQPRRGSTLRLQQPQIELLTQINFIDLMIQLQTLADRGWEVLKADSNSFSVEIPSKALLLNEHQARDDFRILNKTDTMRLELSALYITKIYSLNKCPVNDLVGF